MKKIWNRVYNYLGWVLWVALAIITIGLIEWMSVLFNMVIFDYIAIGLFGLAALFVLVLAARGVIADIKSGRETIKTVPRKVKPGKSKDLKKLGKK